ncbi:alpha-16-mannosyltransferase subunit [Fusarium albosuccineum]|uniref:Alpha-16-mannosyltransferase subunit n=1 Tax=Fusarium albosuccineum TaxID=1237068 RepID=A0A8H4LDR4_9HYPO|nr:alpha-16-mannosyltransferase subunit [Fusarium albosuccineum]
MAKRGFDDFSGDANANDHYRYEPQAFERQPYATGKHDPSAQPLDNNALVCFGMAAGLTGHCCLNTPSYNVQNYPVRFRDNETFIGTTYSEFRGRVASEFVYLITTLLGEPALELEANVSVSDETSGSFSKNKSSRMAGYSIPCTLEIIIYGPIELFDDIGSFFEDHDLYLHDPTNCQRNVPYCNPHWFTLHSSVPRFTSQLALEVVQPVAVEDIDTRPDLLDILNSKDDLAEAEQPQAIKTTLAKHQKQALTFMLQRENGWAWDGCRPDIWEIGTSRRGEEHYFHNRVSNTYQADEPPQFYGGVIADPMGLGKSLSMIALIACDLQLDLGDPSSLSGADAEKSSGRTLARRRSASLHVFPNSLPWVRHHGKSRLTDSSELEDMLVVLTTYHTVMREWGSGSGVNNSILFTTRWKRVILDEAHAIRNGESQMARSICSLNSVARWAVTGTPIQNKLGDLATLLKFLEAYPYMNKRAFEMDISHLWRSGQVEEAVKRLKRLSSCLLLRRPKGILQLPQRRDTQCIVQFTPSERHLYEDIKAQAIAQIDQALHYSGDARTSSSFVNVLQKIEAMRMVCDLGLDYHSRHESSQSRGVHEEDWPSISQRVFNLQREAGQVQCQTCSSTADIVEELTDSPHSNMSLYSRCLRFVSANAFESEETYSMPLSNLSGKLPTKVSALLKDLQKLPGDKKCVVFSTWKMTLNVVEASLKQSSIPCLRFDGSVSQKDRQGVIDRFRKDPTIRVLLLTLSCGAVGLTLTEASRAYLMEPHWNPTVEDQALARIHRMGQTREVTTVRFIVQNSFEERVIEIQESKRDLAGILLNPHDGSKTETTVKPLEWLRRLL